MEKQKRQSGCPGSGGIYCSLDSDLLRSAPKPGKEGKETQSGRRDKSEQPILALRLCRRRLRSQKRSDRGRLGLPRRWPPVFDSCWVGCTMAGELASLSSVTLELDKVAPFLIKLFEIVSSPASDYLICWSEMGDSFRIIDRTKFAQVRRSRPRRAAPWSNGSRNRGVAPDPTAQHTLQQTFARDR